MCIIAASKGAPPTPHTDTLTARPYYGTNHTHKNTHSVPHAVFGSDRLDHSRPFNPYLANPLAATINYAGNPSLVRVAAPRLPSFSSHSSYYIFIIHTNHTTRQQLYSGFRSFNTSHANAQHYVHYLADVAAESDFEFAFRVEDDYANAVRFSPFPGLTFFFSPIFSVGSLLMDRADPSRRDI